MEPQFKHFREARVTLAVIMDGQNTCIGACHCGKYDNFCKATGRKIALDRAKTSKPHTKFQFRVSQDAVESSDHPGEVDWAATWLLVHQMMDCANMHRDFDQKWRLS